MSHENEASKLCLRCKSVPLRRLPESSDYAAFFECPNCQRHYAQQKGGALTYRWLHPISLALQPVLHDKHLKSLAPRIAKLLAANRSHAEIGKITREIEIELEEPTQPVREILGNAANEDECRRFLVEVVEELKKPA